jgi:hypothetical protein
MDEQTSRAVTIAADNEWQTKRAAPVELTPADAKTLFAAIKQLSGDSERLDWLESKAQWHDPENRLKIIFPIETVPHCTIRDAIDAAIRKDGGL